MSNGNNEELERFRQQWQQEVSQRSRGPGKRTAPATRAIKSPQVSASSSTAAPKISSSGDQASSSNAPVLSAASARDNYQDTYIRGTYDFDDLEAREDARRLGVTGTGVHPEARNDEPQTALEHFERAVEKEAQGNMQASLLHYRKAYKLDDQVDLAYRKKHFPPTKFQSKPSNINPSKAAVTVPNTAHHSLHGSATGAISALILSFADSAMQAAPPEVEGAPQLPCPIVAIPREILLAILSEMALSDVASLMRMASTCKQLAYLTHVEDSLWKSICWDSKHGFPDMHYDFALTVDWHDLPKTLDEHLESLTLDNNDDSSKAVKLLPTLTPSYPRFLDNFHFRPRIRFSGVYISTVNYVRAGASTANSVYWGNAPVHMVTYYRYLRFYRDGSAISLLTTYEPLDVVPLFHKKNFRLTKDGRDRQPNPTGPVAPTAAAQAGQGTTTAPPPPTMNAVMRYVKRGRWRLSLLQNKVNEGDENPDDETGKQASEPEGNVYVETEGANSHYTYHMQLVMRSVRAPGVAQNTKLVWRSFWSYNHVTDDWGEFALRNDKAFVFSRVKSWVDSA